MSIDRHRKFHLYPKKRIPQASLYALIPILNVTMNEFCMVSNHIPTMGFRLAYTCTSNLVAKHYENVV